MPRVRPGGCFHAEEVLRRFIACGQSREDFIREAKFFLALELFELAWISSGKAAELCHMGRADFLAASSRAGVPVAMLDESEVADELRDV